MNRLIRAERYRTLKTYHLALWTVLFCALFTFIGFLDFGFDSKAKAMQEFPLFMEDVMVMLIYLPMFVGGMFVASYENKTLQKGTIIIFTCISGVLNQMDKTEIEDYGLREMYKRTRVLFNRYADEMFFSMLKKYGVEKVTMYGMEKQMKKRYGFFTV